MRRALATLGASHLVRRPAPQPGESRASSIRSNCATAAGSCIRSSTGPTATSGSTCKRTTCRTTRCGTRATSRSATCTRPAAARGRIRRGPAVLRAQARVRHPRPRRLNAAAAATISSPLREAKCGELIQIGLLAAAICCGDSFAAEATGPCAVPGDTKTAEWRNACDSAIVAEQDDALRGKLLFGRAYAAVEEYRYDDALNDLGAALVHGSNESALPARACLHQRRAVELRRCHRGPRPPDRTAAKQCRRILRTGVREAPQRRSRGRVPGSCPRRRTLGRCVRLDRARAPKPRCGSASSTPATADAAEIIKSTNDEAELKRASDLQAAVELLSAPGHANPYTMRSMTTKDARAQIADCTRAFLDARDGRAKAQALTSRSLGWQLIPDQNRATDDAAVAVGLDPNNPRPLARTSAFSTSVPNTHGLVNACSRVRFRSKRSPMALAGHAQALSNLGQPEAAFKEAMESFGIDGNEAATWFLADASFERGDLRSRRSGSTSHFTGAAPGTTA